MHIVYPGTISLESLQKFLEAYYHSSTGRKRPFAETVEFSKREILEELSLQKAKVK